MSRLLRSRRFGAFSYVALVALVFGSALGLARAEDEPPAPADEAPSGPAAADAPPRPEVHKLYIPYRELRRLFEKEGDGVFLPFDQFQTLWERAYPTVPDRTKPPLPYAMRAASWRGAADGENLRIEGSIELEALVAGWQRIPLGINGLGVESATLDGTPALIVSRGDELDLVVSSRGAHRLELVLRGVAPATGDAHAIQFSLPRVPLARFDLSVTGRDAEVTLKPLVPTSSRRGPDGRTHLIAWLGPVDRIELGWRRRPEEGPAEAPIVFVENETLVTADRGVVRSLARLRFSVHRAPVSQVRLVVPPSAVVLFVQGETVRSWTRSEDGTALDIDLREPTREPVAIAVGLESASAAPPVDIVAPWVGAEGVERERGFLRIEAVDGVRVEPTTTEGLVAIDVKDLPESLREEARPGRTRAYRFSARPPAPTLAITALEPRVVATVGHRVALLADGLAVLTRIALDVERAGLFGIDVPIPDGVEVSVTASNGIAIEDWRVRDDAGPRRLAIAFRDRLLGKAELFLRARAVHDVPERTGETSLAIVPLLLPSGIDHARGHVVVHAEAALDRRVVEKPGLTILDEGVAGVLEPAAFEGERARLPVVHRFEHRDAPIGLSIELSRKAPTVTCAVETIARIDPDRTAPSVTLRYDVAFRAVDTFRFSGPIALASRVHLEQSGMSLLGPESEPKPPDAPDDWTAERGTWTVKLVAPRLGAVVVPLLLDDAPEAPLVSGASRRAELPRFVPLDADRKPLPNVVHHIAIRRDPLLEVAVERADGGEEIDVRELPASMRGDDAFLALRSYAAEHRFTLAVTRHDYEPVAEVVVTHQHLETVVPDEGRAITEAWLIVRNNDRQYLRLRLPGRATVRAVRVGGQSESPRVDPGAEDVILVPLLTGLRKDEAFEIALVFEHDIERDDGVVRSVRVRSPEPLDADADLLTWHVYLPDADPITSFGGSVEAVAGEESWAARTLARLGESVVKRPTGKATPWAHLVAGLESPFATPKSNVRHAFQGRVGMGDVRISRVAPTPLAFAKIALALLALIATWVVGRALRRAGRSAAWWVVALVLALFLAIVPAAPGAASLLTSAFVGVVLAGFFLLVGAFVGASQRAAAAAAAGAALIALSVVAAPSGLADERADEIDPVGPIERVFVPDDQLDLLLETQRRGVVLDHEAFRRLLLAARRAGPDVPTHAGGWVDAVATLDLATADHARLEGSWTAILADPSITALEFPWKGAAIESIRGERTRLVRIGVTPQIAFDGPGTHRVDLIATAAIRRAGGSSRVELHVPPAAAMAFDVVLPPGVVGSIEGFGSPRQVRTPPGPPTTWRVRPASDGRLAVTFAASADVAEGPPILDAHVTIAHRLGEGRDDVRASIAIDVFRSPTARIDLDVPADFALHQVGGDGVVRSTRSEDRTRLVLELDRPRAGRITATLLGEAPFPNDGTRDLATLHVAGALRERATVGLALGPDIRANDIVVADGRRIAAAKNDPSLRFDLDSAAGRIGVTLRPVATRLEAVGTHYLNLTETGRSLLVTTTYRVVEGVVHRLRPRIPNGFELRRLTIDGREDGFERDARPDGTIDISLSVGIVEGGEVLLTALLEHDRADWLPEGTAVELPFEVPSAGADREEGFVAIGADAAFEVRERGRRDLVAVGAEELTTRGVRAEGLIFGYRIDGPAPSVAIEIERRIPVVQAEVVTTLSPGPRRLHVTAVVVHDVRRAGVRQVRVDVPAWAGDEVRFDGTSVRGHAKDAAATDLAPGYVRYVVSFGEWIVGRHTLVVGWHRDFDEEGWTLSADVPLLPDVPLDRVERYVVVRRADGLEARVDLSGLADARTVEVTDLPTEAPADPLATLDVLHLAGRRDGLGLGVRRHGGAAVLDAIGTVASLNTAVAREGVLRTRATLWIENAGRQQVAVALPPRSHLIGALVGTAPERLEAVKPLRARDGTVLIPLTGAGVSKVVLALTYETRLDGPLEGSVEVRSPQFPGLEVLATTHVVAFDDDLRVLGMEGDFGAFARPAPTPKPWIAGMASLLRHDDTKPEASAPPTSSPPSSGPTLREQIDDANRKAMQTDEPDAGPLLDGEDKGARGAEPSPSSEPPPAPPAPERSKKDEANEALDPGEGGRIRDARSGLEFGTRRRGLLSLDVPVALGPTRIVGHRAGQGGSLVVTFERVGDARTRSRIAFGILLAIAAIAAWGSRRRRIATVLGLVAAAIAIRLALGSRGAAWSVAAIDAATVLVAVALGRALYGLVMRRVTAPRVTAASAAATSALLLLVALIALAPSARAEDEHPLEPRRIYVPYDPESPDPPRDPDRVFLPLETWSHLALLAGLDRAPADSGRGERLATTSVAWHLAVEADAVEGRLSIGLVKDGGVPSSLGLPLGGVSLVAAYLDGVPTSITLVGGVAVITVDTPGEHALELDVRVPLVVAPDGVRRVRFVGWAFPSAKLDLVSGSFAGDVVAAGPLRVERLADGPGGRVDRIGLGTTGTIDVRLVPPGPAALPDDVRVRATTRIVHSLRDGGTETDVALVLDVLTGRIPFADLGLPNGTNVLEASGDAVSRWETIERAGVGPALRLHWRVPQSGRIEATVRIVRPATTEERDEDLPSPRMLDVTAESGEVVVNVPAHRRAEILAEDGLVRIELPRDPRACGLDRGGVVVRAWRFGRPETRLAVRLRAADRRIDLRETTRVVAGHDAVRTWIDATLHVSGAPVGEFAFGVPGADEVRSVSGRFVRSWWLAGEGLDRRLFVRLDDVRAGAIALRLVLERARASADEGAAVPRLVVPDAREEVGRCVLYARPDVEVVVGSLPGLKAAEILPQEQENAPVAGARATHAFVRERALASSLPFVLRRPEPGMEATVVTLVVPGEREHRLEQLVLVEVLRGAVDVVQVFVPDGGARVTEDVRATDLREVRRSAVSRAGPDGRDLSGTLYEVAFQSARSGILELVFSCRWEADRPVHAVRPEGMGAVRWFLLTRTWTDGQVTPTIVAGRADEASWRDVPFVPVGVPREAVLKSWVARAPFALSVSTMRHRIGAQADAVVLAAEADAVVGRDGEARVRVTYRVFNRALQFLTVRLPAAARLFGASSAGQAVKPLAAPDGALLLPVPKVPLGGEGYPVTILYGVRVAPDLVAGGRGEFVLPSVDGVEIERTAVRLGLPDGYEVTFDTRMERATEAAVHATWAEAEADEVQRLLAVAESGTLAQREQALANGATLLGQARQRAYRDAGARAAAINEALARLDGAWRRQQTALERDLRAARSSVQTATVQTHFAGNAARIVDVQQGAGSGGAPSDATWLFNFAEEESAAAAGVAPPGLDPEIGALKVRLGTSLEKSRGQFEQAERDSDDGVAATQEQVAWLNANLAQSQESRQQLGAGRGAAEVGTIYRVQNGEVISQQGFLVFSGDGDTSIDIVGGGGGGAGRHRRFDSEGRAGGESRSGLMGIDVPLPRGEQVVYFTGLKAGGRIAFDLASTAPRTAWRLVLLAALLGVIALGWVTWVRRNVAAPA